MSAVPSVSIRLAVDPAATATASGFVPGTIMSAKVLSRDANGALLDVMGRQTVAKLPANIEAGETISLRVLSISVGDVTAQLLTAPAAPSTNAATPTSVAQTVRRIVDAAAGRLFGTAPVDNPRPAASAVRAGSALSVSVRGERPSLPLVEFDPAELRGSPLLAAASAEDLLAAQAALERLQIPPTALTMAAALPQANDPVRLASVLTRLDAALREQSPEARVATLRTLSDFLSRIIPDQDSSHAQLSSFVDQVAVGGEAKLAALLQALGARVTAPPAQRLSLTAYATERATALTNDLKTQLTAYAKSRSDEASLTTLLTEALEAVTAAQLTSLNAARRMPDAVAFVLPIAVGKATLPAQVTVHRDAPEGRHRRVDAENFRIDFVIETLHLGSVRVTLDSVNRAIKVVIDTQTSRSADLLRAKADDLRRRLGELPYRVLSISAEMTRNLAQKETMDHRRAYIPSLRGEITRNDVVHLDTKA